MTFKDINRIFHYSLGVPHNVLSAHFVEFFHISLFKKRPKNCVHWWTSQNEKAVVLFPAIYFESVTQYQMLFERGVYFSKSAKDAKKLPSAREK
jgi:hypothetical protein